MPTTFGLWVLTMIKKMARAICRNDMLLSNPDASEADVSTNWYTNGDVYMSNARAAMETIQPEIMKVFEPYLSSEYSIPKSITAGQIHDDMKAMIHEALKETKP